MCMYKNSFSHPTLYFLFDFHLVVIMGSVSWICWMYIAISLELLVNQYLLQQ